MNKKRAKLPGADVLFGDSQPIEQQNVLTLNNQNVKQPEHLNIEMLKHQEEDKTQKQQMIKAEKKQNIMATVYFSSETIKEIEKARVKLLTDYDLKVNKSQMVEASVRNMLKDLDLLSRILTK